MALMDLDLRRLRYFATVAEELSFVRAAALLHMTQPALSRQVSALERDLSTLPSDRNPSWHIPVPDYRRGLHLGDRPARLPHRRAGVCFVRLPLGDDTFTTLPLFSEA
jgi:hypothetical protein